MKLKIPPPVYMLIFASAMWLANNYLPLYQWQLDTQYFGMVIIILGFAVDLSSLVGFIKAKTSINPMKPEKTQALVTSGMHSFSRNPMYLGLLLLLSGWSLYLGNLSAVLLLPLFMVVLTKMQIQPEEKILEEKFGHAYIEYKQKVRRWI